MLQQVLSTGTSQITVVYGFLCNWSDTLKYFLSSLCRLPIYACCSIVVLIVFLAKAPDFWL